MDTLEELIEKLTKQKVKVFGFQMNALLFKALFVFYALFAITLAVNLTHIFALFYFAIIILISIGYEILIIFSAKVARVLIYIAIGVSISLILLFSSAGIGAKVCTYALFFLMGYFYMSVIKGNKS